MQVILTGLRCLTLTTLAIVVVAVTLSLSWEFITALTALAAFTCLTCGPRPHRTKNWIAAAISDKPGARGLALKWRVHHLYIESQAAGQQGWYYVFKDRLTAIANKNRNEIIPTVRPLKTDRAPNAKATRIRGMESIFENGFFWVRRRGQEKFAEEYEKYPNGETIDILDLIGYCPQTLGHREPSAGTRFHLHRDAAQEKGCTKPLCGGILSATCLFPPRYR